MHALHFKKQWVIIENSVLYTFHYMQFYEYQLSRNNYYGTKYMFTVLFNSLINKRKLAHFRLK